MGARKTKAKARRGAAVSSAAPSVYSLQLVAVFSQLIGDDMEVEIKDGSGSFDPTITVVAGGVVQVWDSSANELIECVASPGSTAGLVVLTPQGGKAFVVDTNYMLQPGSQAVRNPKGATLVSSFLPVPE